MSRITALLCICVVLVSAGCDKIASSGISNTNFTLVNSNDLYQVALPDYMSEATNLSDEAALQYQNLFKELYVVVLDEPLLDFQETFQELGLYNDSLSVIDNYTDAQYNTIIEGLDIKSEVIQKSVKINGLPARIVEFDAEVEDIDVPITYYYTFFEGKENVYLMLAWTLQTKRKKYQPILEKISKSFRLISDMK
ncbi:MAG: hypothetical protein ACI8SE_000044 [Bacteroidia bacterium]|jgi:hypothetical protein